MALARGIVSAFLGTLALAGVAAACSSSSSGSSAPISVCLEYCDVLKSNCNGEHSVFTGDAECLVFCGLFDDGSRPSRDIPVGTMGDTASCRRDLAIRAGGDKSLCKGAGFLSAGVCAPNTAEAMCTKHCDAWRTVCAGVGGMTAEGCRAACLADPVASSYDTAVGDVSGGPNLDKIYHANNMNCRHYHLQSGISNKIHCEHAYFPSSTCNK